MAEDSKSWQIESPLPAISCSSFDCENDLHSFRTRRPKDATYRNGRCVACDVDLIDWTRIDRLDPEDVGHTVIALQNELIRHFYWHIDLDQYAVNHATRKGRIRFREAIHDRLGKYLKPPSSELFRDGTQTPKSRNVIFYAQHATATCCRLCFEEWYGIPREQELTDAELEYAETLVEQYVAIKMPNLQDDPTHVPAIRKSD